MDAEAHKEFMREVEIMKKIDHPHIYNIFSIFEDKKTFYLISEFLEGGDFFEHLAKVKKINEEDACRVIKTLLSSVYYLH